MKQLMLKFTFILTLPTLAFCQKAITATVPYDKPLPTIEADGTLKMEGKPTVKINGFQDSTATIFFLVRHSERDTGGVKADLTAVGRGRAAAFVKIFQHVKLTKIYSTDTPRTRHTAEPLAKSKRQIVDIYDAGKQDDMTRRLADRRGKRFFIVGHSNTIPKFISLLKGADADSIPNIPDDSFSRLYIVTVRGIGAAKIQMIEF